MSRTIKYNEVFDCGHEVDVAVTYCDSINRHHNIECSTEYNKIKDCHSVKIIEVSRYNELSELQDSDKQILCEIRVRIG